jgi:aspartyl-tRNA(Asn)/glutamyl-tRNA(Gln) amidotransferase subunit A
MDAWSTAAEIAEAVAGGKVSALSVAEEALARIEQHNSVLNAFTTVTAVRARETARAIDAARESGQRLGPLAGVPFAVKNLFDVAGIPTLAGSKINRERQPAKSDSPLVTRLESAGAILVGALNMGEYAYDFTGENVHDGPSRNPHDTTRMTGGSSGGSGGAVAGALVPFNSRALIILRIVRTEADVWSLEPRAHVPLCCESRSSRPAGAQHARSGACL